MLASIPCIFKVTGTMKGQRAVRDHACVSWVVIDLPEYGPGDLPVSMRWREEAGGPVSEMLWNDGVNVAAGGHVGMTREALGRLPDMVGKPRSAGFSNELYALAMLTGQDLWKLTDAFQMKSGGPRFFEASLFTRIDASGMAGAEAALRARLEGSCMVDAVPFFPAPEPCHLVSAADGSVLVSGVDRIRRTDSPACWTVFRADRAEDAMAFAASDGRAAVDMRPAPVEVLIPDAVTFDDEGFTAAACARRILDALSPSLRVARRPEVAAWLDLRDAAEAYDAGEGSPEGLQEAILAMEPWVAFDGEPQELVSLIARRIGMAPIPFRGPAP